MKTIFGIKQIERPQETSMMFTVMAISLPMAIGDVDDAYESTTHTMLLCWNINHTF